MSFKSWYERWIYNPKAKKIACDMKNNPERWRQERYSPISGAPFVVENEKGLEIWVANGWLFCRINEPCEELLGLVGRTVVWSAYKSLNLPKRNPNGFNRNGECI